MVRGDPSQQEGSRSQPKGRVLDDKAGQGLFDGVKELGAIALDPSSNLADSVYALFLSMNGSRPEASLEYLTGEVLHGAEKYKSMGAIYRITIDKQDDTVRAWYALRRVSGVGNLEQRSNVLRSVDIPIPIGEEEKTGVTAYAHH